MKIPLSNKTKIYVVAPAGVVTGGPEDLYQLADSLHALYPATAVLMYYLPQTAEHPVADVYKHFNTESAREIEDAEDNVLIIPEVYATKFDGLQKIKKVIWWLSVDNYYFSPALTSLQRRINGWLLKLGIGQYLFFNNNLKKIKWHLTQSHYGYEHLKRKGVKNVFYQIDHVHPDFAAHTIDESIKENIVAYNPKKGFAFTKKIIRACPGITFVPIQNMSREQVMELLKKTKVYIDFGNHPGGDRFPKEAALLGCCVITGKRGSAKYFDDVPIPPDYKFSQTPWAHFLVREKIKNCFADYHNEARRFVAFRERAKKDRDTQRSDIQYLFSPDSRA
jgi:hypothetical protein